MARLGLGLGLGLGRTRARGVTVPLPPSAPVGFARNGSTNAALAAMLARVAGGTGRGTIVVKGDSTSAGAGAGGRGDVVTQLTGARPGRVSATLAAALSAHGIPTLDHAFVGDNGCGQFGVGLPAYDPRVAYPGTAWDPAGGQGFSGGNFLNPGPDPRVLDFTLPTVSHFVVDCYNVGGRIGFAVDGALATGVTAAGATVSGNTVLMPATNSGFTRVIVPAGTSATHRLGMAGNGGNPLVRSARGYDVAVPAVDVINHASSGATSTEQAASGNRWGNNDALGFDAPDLTIVNLGLNDTGMQVPVTSYIAALAAIVARARVSGDVLLVFPHPAGGQFATNVTAYRDAAAAFAADQRVAFVSLFDHFGGAFTPALQARMADGLVHGDAGFYAEVGEVYRRCMMAMVG